MQTFLIFALFAAALAYVGWRVLRPFFVKETGCGKGCGCAPEPVSLAKKAVQAFQRQR